MSKKSKVAIVLILCAVAIGAFIHFVVRPECKLDWNPFDCDDMDTPYYRVIG